MVECLWIDRQKKFEDENDFGVSLNLQNISTYSSWNQKEIWIGLPLRMLISIKSVSHVLLRQS